MRLNEADEDSGGSDLLWGCFVGWVETLEKVEKRPWSDPKRKNGGP
jgi:hypothetical protein